VPIYSLGALNTTALSAPDVYVQKVNPKTLYINGVTSDILGLVGAGSWGPVNAAVLASPDTFGPVTVRSHDLATALAVSAQQGAQNVRAVRVTDGTDVAASAVLKDAGGTVTGLTLTAMYTGTVGNGLTATLSAGTAAASYKLTISRTDYSPEIFDNLTGTIGAGGTLWATIANAVNLGQSGIRGPSRYCVAAVGSSILAPSTTTTTALFAGGTDGATWSVAGSDSAALIGADSNNAPSRKGMYALRGSGAQVLALIDYAPAAPAWSTIAAFADSEGMYAVVAAPVSNDYSATSSQLATAGADTPSLKVMVGDWLYWYDSLNGVNRLLSPATFVAAEIANLSPHQSALNKPLSGLTGSQRRGTAPSPYTPAEVGAVATARLDVVTNPCPGGSYYGCRTGRNASSDPTRNGDNYTRMTNYLALTLAGAYGFVVGQPQTSDLRLKVKASMEAFLSNLEQQGMIGDPNGGKAFSVTLNASNNPASRVAQGYMQADVQVKYLSIVWFFLVNLEGGQSVTVRQVNS